MKAIEVRHEYLRIALNCNIVAAQIEAVASTTAGNIGINGAQLPETSWCRSLRLQNKDAVVGQLFDLLGALGVLRRRVVELEECVGVARDVSGFHRSQRDPAELELPNVGMSTVVVGRDGVRVLRSWRQPLHGSWC